MKFKTLLISRTKQIHAKPLSVSESILKIMVMSYRPFFPNCAMSEVICKQRLSYEHKIGRYLQNCKCYVETLYKVIKRPYKIALKGSVFSRAVKFSAIFDT